MHTGGSGTDEERLRSSEEEAARLRWELTGVTSALNGLRRLRLIRAFDRYRAARYRLTESALGLRAALVGRPAAAPDAGGAGPRPAPAAAYDVLLFSYGDWRWRVQRPQHLARQWAARGHRVFFIAPDFRPVSNPAYTARPAAPFVARAVSEGIWEVHLAAPRALSPLSQRLLASDTQGLTETCGRLADRLGIDRAVSFVELPFWAPVARAMRESHGWKLIYDCIDRIYGVFPDAHSMLAEEPDLVRDADLVVVTAEILARDLGSTARSLALVPNAADPDRFARPSRRPSGLLGLPRPLLGYVGAINAWFDADLVAELARRHPEWTIVLAGSGTQETRALQGLDNVHLAGEVPFDEVPGTVQAFDACLVPFKPLPVIAATDPVKFYEYVAAGKPVVSTDLPELRRHAGMAYLATGADAFEEAVLRALSEDGPVPRERRSQFARENSWEARFGVLDSAIRGLDEPGCPALQGPAAHSCEDSAIPFITRVEPDAIRPLTARGRGQNDVRLILVGRGFTRECQALIDEEPLPTAYASSTLMTCTVDGERLVGPGCRMISVVDTSSWKQSNRRVFLVERL